MTGLGLRILLRRNRSCLRARKGRRGRKEKLRWRNRLHRLRRLRLAVMLLLSRKPVWKARQLPRSRRLSRRLSPTNQFNPRMSLLTRPPRKRASLKRLSPRQSKPLTKHRGISLPSHQRLYLMLLPTTSSLLIHRRRTPRKRRRARSHKQLLRNLSRTFLRNQHLQVLKTLKFPLLRESLRKMPPLESPQLQSTILLPPILLRRMMTGLLRPRLRRERKRRRVRSRKLMTGRNLKPSLSRLKVHLRARTLLLQLILDSSLHSLSVTNLKSSQRPKRLRIFRSIPRQLRIPPLSPKPSTRRANPLPPTQLNRQHPLSLQAHPKRNSLPADGSLGGRGARRRRRMRDLRPTRL